MSILPSYQMVRWWFPRLLAGIYLIAFVSWGVQYRGLVGEEGILPVENLIQEVHAAEKRTGEFLLPDFPAIQYFNGSEAFGLGLVIAGASLSVLVMAGVGQRWLLLLLWMIYLSLCLTGQVFMGFQWDSLLLEAGLLAVWLAPGGLWSWRIPPSPPRGSVFLLHWLLFRLMLLSGVVKLWSGDEVWRNMTALVYHYETQPLPHLLSWHVHQWPKAFHIASCWAMYAIELVLPFAIFFGRWGRIAACAGFIALMAAVVATGNYNFFNILTAVLALTLLDDACWPRRLKGLLGLNNQSPPRQESRTTVYLRRILSTAAVTMVILITATAADLSLAARKIGNYKGYMPKWFVENLLAPVEPFRSFNSYGLFQDMTTERPEIIVEVSDDGILWLPLEFKWKPGDLKRTPGWATPHQPRLDWQMWFAALYPGFEPQRDSRPGSPNAWFGAFLSALLEQKQPVWDLLEKPPFPQKDIRHVRARLYRYHFTDAKTQAETGEWWRREYLGSYSPPFGLRTTVD